VKEGIANSGSNCRDTTVFAFASPASVDAGNFGTQQMTGSTIRVGFIGTGRISDLHAVEYCQNRSASIVAVCDQDPDLAAAKARAWGCEDAAVLDDPAALLSRPDVDLVEILLPHHLHLPVALEAIERGKIVSLQKPICLTMPDADLLVAAAEQSDKPFKVFENFVFFPPVMKARELIESNAIGTPISIRIKSNPGKSSTAWKVPESALAWRMDRRLSGGGPLVFDDGQHKFAIARHFMGNPEAVHAFIGETLATDASREGGFVDAPAQVSFRFPRNRMGNLEIVYSPELTIETKTYAQDDRVEITGTHGILWIDGGHGRLPGVPPLTLYRDGEFTHFSTILADWKSSFVLSVRHFLEVLGSGGEPVLTARDARDVLRFALAAERSARIGNVVEVAS